MQNKQYIFVLFPPGLGGNHFKNILGLYSNLYNIRDIEPIYDDKMSSVHAIGLNLHKEGIISDIKKFSHTVLFCGHIGEYLFVNNLFEQLKNKKFVVFNWSNNDIDKLQSRLSKLYYNYFEDLYFLEEQKQLYSSKNVSKLVGCDHITIVNVQDFISLDNIKLLDTVAKDLSLQAGYNINHCKALHTKWLIKNDLMAP